MNKELRLSVHELVDFLFRTGDIDKRSFKAETMKEGSNIHSWFQSLQKQDYISKQEIQSSSMSLWQYLKNYLISRATIVGRHVVNKKLNC